MRDVGKRIRTIRNQKKMTIKEVAESANIAISTLSYIEFKVTFFR